MQLEISYKPLTISASYLDDQLMLLQEKMGHERLGLDQSDSKQGQLAYFLNFKIVFSQLLSDLFKCELLNDHCDLGDAYLLNMGVWSDIDPLIRLISLLSNT